MINVSDNELVEKILADVKACYDAEHIKLKSIGETHKTEGEIRHAAGQLVENVLQSVFNSINKYLTDKVESKVGKTDYLKKSIEYKGETYINDTIQVDRHIWFKGKRIAFIENKTYLDSCYYDRALADFKKITQALVQDGKDPKSCEFIVFAGQKAAKENTLLTYEGEFWHETKAVLESDCGIEPKVFYFLKNNRSSKKPLYAIKHEFNENTVREFIKLMIALIEKHA